METHAHYYIDENGFTFNSAVFDNHNEKLLLEVKQFNNAIEDICSINTTIKNYEHLIVGGFYKDKIFYGISPYPSWITNAETGTWTAPVPKPDSGFWKWNEETLSWQELPIPANE